MSKTFAVLSANTVVNVIIANSLEDAEMVTNTECVEYDPENPVVIGSTRVDGKWVDPKPATDPQA
jgi:hypothetical protein